MVIFETLDITIVANVCIFLLYEGMFCWYIAIYEMIKVLRENMEKRQKESVFGQSCRFKRWLTEYRHLEMHTIQINNCYQEKYALSFKPVLMFTIIVFGTLLLEPELRLSTSLSGLILSSYALINTVILVAIGYYIPGKVNEISRSILAKFRSMAVERSCLSYSLKEYKRTIRAFRDVRIYIGTVNFYERMTALNILNFLVNQTINLILLT